MKLISCDNCGVVLDKDKLNFPDDIQDEDGINEEKAVWDGDDFVAFVLCPVCSDTIPESSK